MGISHRHGGRVSRMLAAFGAAALISSSLCSGQSSSSTQPQQCPESEPRYLGQGGRVAAGALLGSLLGLKLGGAVGQGAGAAMGAAAGADSTARPVSGQLDVTAMNRQQRELADRTGCQPHRYIRN